MVTISLQAIAECFLCLTHLLFGLAAERVFNAFALLAFLNFAAFSIFHMRYLLMVWNAQRPPNANNAWESVRQELSLLYLRFCTSGRISPKYGYTRLTLPFQMLGSSLSSLSCTT